MTQHTGKGWRPLVVIAVLVAGRAAAAMPATTMAETTNWSLGIDAERWQLPGDETAGLAGLHLRRQVTETLRLGIDSFAAVQGRRGGFITLGVGGEARYPLGHRLDLELGASVSAGGGRGGHELSGGGLMLRESAGIGLPLGDWRWRAGISHVDFPNGGTIASTQGYLGVERLFSSLMAAPGASSGHYSLPEATELERTDVGAFIRQYRVRPGSLTDTGAAQPDFGLVGAEWRGHLQGPWFVMIDAAGAAHGQSNGYMEIMGGVGGRWPLSRRFSLDAGVLAGAGGGGAVDTGGGFLLAARAGAALQVTSADELALGIERMKAPSGHLSVDGVSLGLRHRFGPDQPMTVASGDAADLDAHGVTLRVIDETYRAARGDWSTRPIPSIGVLGIAADLDLSPVWYLTGQGLAAYRGESGAYMTGLLGAGLHLPMTDRWRFEAEALAGAAGGGGVAVASGAVAEVKAGLGYETTGGIGIRITAGRLRALHGPFAANVIGVAVSTRMTLLTGTR
jgi:hypothetical protein